MAFEDAYLLDFPAIPATTPGLPHRSFVDPARADAKLLGIDIDVIDDLPPTFRLAYGPKALANYVLRELITPEGFLAVYFEGDPHYGQNVRGRLNSAWTFQELSSLGGAIEAKLRRHDRIESATVAVSHDLATSTLSVDISIETAAGPFRFLLAVTDLTVEVLRAE
jgi:hypothetical protein